MITENTNTATYIIKFRSNALADLGRGVRELQQKIEDNPLDNEEERKSCMFV